MGYLKYVRELWKKPAKNPAYRELLLKVRREPVTVRLERPTRIDRARSLGYRAKQGVIVVRQRVTRGGRMRPDIKGGRRSAHSSQRKVVQKSYQAVAEARAQFKFKNCEVLSSYKLLQDGKSAWFEIIMLDRESPVIKADKDLSGVAKQRNRTGRGITSSGRKSRGLMSKGVGAEKIRPSLRANLRRH